MAPLWCWSGCPSGYLPVLKDVFAQTGAFEFALGPRDEATVVTLPPEAYTVQVSGSDGGTGVALVEVYDLDSNFDRAAGAVDWRHTMWCPMAFETIGSPLS